MRRHTHMHKTHTIHNTQKGWYRVCCLCGNGNKLHLSFWWWWWWCCCGCSKFVASNSTGYGCRALLLLPLMLNSILTVPPLDWFCGNKEPKNKRTKTKKKKLNGGNCDFFTLVSFNLFERRTKYFERLRACVHGIKRMRICCVCTVCMY